MIRRFRLKSEGVMITVESIEPLDNKKLRSLIAKLASSDELKDDVSEVFLFTSTGTGINKVPIEVKFNKQGEKYYLVNDTYGFSSEEFHSALKTNKPIDVYRMDSLGRINESIPISVIIIGDSYGAVKEAAIKRLFEE